MIYKKLSVEDFIPERFADFLSMFYERKKVNPLLANTEATKELTYIMNHTIPSDQSRWSYHANVILDLILIISAVDLNDGHKTYKFVSEKYNLKK